MADTYDLIAIGAGPAGESATELASFFGHRSAVIEKALPGGTVTTAGRAPTRTLREAAPYLTGFSEREIYGLQMAAPPEVAVDIIRERTNSVCELLSNVRAGHAAGDVVRPTLASIAMEQGRVAVCHAFGIPFDGTVDPCPVSAVCGMPELSGAGLTEEQCRESGLDHEVGRADLGLTPRGAIAGKGGLLKLIFLRTNRKLIGVHCVGDIASEIVGIGQMVIRCGGTLNTITNISLNTPTYSYAYKYAAFDGLRRLAAGGPTVEFRPLTPGSP